MNNSEDLPLLKTVSIIGGSANLSTRRALKKVDLDLYNSNRTQLTQLVTDICANITSITQNFDWDNADLKEAKLIGGTVMKLAGKLTSMKELCEEDELAKTIITKTIKILCVDLQTAYNHMNRYFVENPFDVDNYDRVNYLGFLGDLLSNLATLIPKTSNYVDISNDDLLLDSEELKWFEN